MFWYLAASRVEQTINVILDNDISPDDLLVKLNSHVRASAPRCKDDVTTIVATIHQFNGIESLEGDSVPLLLWLSALICTLRSRGLTASTTAMEIGREVYMRMPIASQRLHKSNGDVLFADEISAAESHPPISGEPVFCESGPSSSSRRKPACVVPAPPPSYPDPEPTIRSTISAPKSATTSAPPVSDTAPLLHPPTILTLATAGAAGGGATMIQMVYLPVARNTGVIEQQCFLMVIAAIPVGALGAVYLWSVAEEIARTRARPEGRLLRYLLISLVALIGGGAISLLAHALADLSFKVGPSLEWLPLGISGAVGSLSGAWSRNMARPTTVFRAVWTAGVAAGGTFLGYMAYVLLVGLLVLLGYDPAPLLALTHQSPAVALGAFVFVLFTQIMMSLQLHGIDALRLRSVGLPLKPEKDLVPPGFLPMTALGALTVALTVLAHSCSFALRAANP